MDTTVLQNLTEDKAPTNQFRWLRVFAPLLLCLFAWSNFTTTTFAANENSETITCWTQVTFNNTGCHAVDVYWWQDNGQNDTYYATIYPGESWTVDTQEGHMWNFYNQGTTSWMNMYTVYGCNNQNHNIDTGGNCNNAQPAQGAACQPNCSAMNTNLNNYMYLGEFDGHVYYKRGTGDVEIWTAKNYADQIGGHLPVINSQAENNFLVNAVQGKFWIDLTDANSEGNFYWANGDPLTYTNWNSGEPNNEGPGGSNADYVRVLESGKWADDSDYSNYWTVVEVDCPCEETACPVTLQINNQGGCAVELYHWVPSGDIYTTTIGPGSSYTVNSTEGEKWRTKIGPFGNLEFDDEYMITGCNNQTFNVNPCPSQGCTGEITGLQINPQDGGMLLNVADGITFCESDFSQDIRLRANASGSHESLRFTVTGAANVANTENVETYDSNQFWANPGTYYVNVKLYSQDGLGGTLCDEKNYTIHVSDCAAPAPMEPSCGNFAVSSGDDQTICTGEAVNLNANSSNANSCPMPCTPNALELVHWNLNNCYSNTGTPGSNMDFNEFNSNVKNNGGCININATDIYSLNGKHSCTSASNGNPGDAMCVSSSTGCNFINANPEGLTFSVTLTPGQTGQISELRFQELAPQQYQWNSDEYPVGNTGLNNYPTQYGVRVTKDGQEIFKQTNIQTTQSWSTESFDFSDNPAFQITSTSTFVFELMGYCPIGNGADVSAWDIDNVRIFGGCCESNEIDNSVSYLWSTGETSQNITVNQSGTYEVTVTDCAGCTATDEVNITIEDLLDPTASNNGPLTCGTASVQMTASGGSTYTWSGPNGFASNQQNPSVSAPGTYTVTVTSDTGCTGTATTTVEEDTTAPSAFANNSGPLTCNLTTAMLTSSGGMAAYSWTGPNGYTSTQQNPTVSAPGTYTVTITNDNGCIDSASTTVTEDVDTPTAFANNSGPLTCNLTTAMLTASGGVTFAWTGPNGFTSIEQNPTVSAPGTYEVTVANQNGCTDTASTSVTEDTTTPNPTASNNGPLTCNITSIQLNGDGGSSYAWTGPNAFASNQQNPTVVAPGTYTLTVTGPNGCTETATTTVAQDNSTPGATASNAGPLTCVTTSVQLNAIGNGSYAWAGPNGFTSNQQNPTVVVPGAYTLTVTGANGCTETAITDVAQNIDTPAATASNDGPLTCNNPVIQLSSTGGGSYAWTGPNGFASGQQNPSTSMPGTYTVTVTSTNGCTAQAVTTVAQDDIIPSINAVNNGPITCANTSVLLSASGGSSYTWSGPNGFTSNQQNPSITQPGNYTVTVAGGNGCTNTATTTVEQDLTTPEASASNNGPFTCNTTSVQLAATGGGVYEWSGPAGFASNQQNPTITAPGTYTVMVMGPNGCTDIATTTVQADETAPSAAANNNGPLTCSTTSVQLGATGGGSYAWTGPNGFTSNQQSPIVALPGNYTVTVTAANGCTDTAVTAVEQNNDVPTAAANNDGPITCEMASVQLSATGGATYAWTGPNGFTSSQQDPVVVEAGNYTVTVTNVNGCTDIATTAVAQDINVPTAAASNDGPLTCDMESIQLTGSGGGSYAWTGPNGFTSTMQNPTATDAGSYTLTVTSDNGCTDTAVTTVVENNETPTATASNDGPLTCNTTSVQLNATGGGSYSWTGPAGFTSAQQNPSVTTPGDYTVTVTNANGCTDSALTTVQEDTVDPTATASNDGPLTCNTTSVQLNATGGGTYAWSGPNGFTANQQSPAVTAPGAYEVTVTAANGCTATAITEVTANDDIPAVTAVGGQFCEGETVALAATGGGTYAWTGPNGFTSTEANPTVSAPGDYIVTVTADNGCTAQATATVLLTEINSELSLNEQICANEPLPLSIVSAGTGATYLWDFGTDASPATSTEINPTVSWSSQGMKNVILTIEKEGCSEEFVGTVLVTEEVFAIAGDDQTICQGEATMLGGDPTGPAGATYDWSPASGLNNTSVANPMASPLSTTTYTVTVTKEGCVDTKQVTVFVETLQCQVDLELVKTVDQTTVNVGDEVAWTISVTNEGPADATGVTVTDALPAGLSVTGVETSTGTFNNASLTWMIGNLNVGQFETLTITTTVDQAGLFENTAQVATADQDDIDSQPGNDDGDQSQDDEDNASVAADFEIASLGDYTFVDQNGNGIQDAGDAPLAGVTVQLYDATDLTAPIGMEVTDADGFYEFTMLDPTIDYVVSFQTDVPDYALTTQSGDASDGGANDSDAGTDGFTDIIDLDPGENDPTIDAGYVFLTASLGDYTFIDADQDGIQDANEAPISDIVVTLYDATDLTTPLDDTTTDANGLYEFTDLDPNLDYVVEFQTDPAGGFQLTTQSGEASDGTADDSDAAADGFTDVIDLDPGENDPTIDAGYFLPLASLGDYTFIDADQDGIQDANEAPISDIVVTLYDATDLTTPLDDTTTDADGLYEFTDLDPNLDYVVEFQTDPAGGFQLTTQSGEASDGTADDSDAAADGFTDIIDLDPGENDPTIDAGYFLPLASLGDYTFIDANQNGIQDTNPDGTPVSDETPISGIVVTLYDATDLTTPIASDTTDANGLYEFTQLDPNNDYVVQFETSTDDGFELTAQSGNASDGTANDSDAAADGFTDIIDLDPGENDPTIDAGYIFLTASLGDYTFIDADQDGIQDANEAPIGGIAVTLYDATDLTTPLATDSTDATGFYEFTNLDPNLDYVVQFETDPAGYELTAQSGNASDGTADDSDAAADGFTDIIDLDPGEHDPTIDAGYNVLLAGLGNFTFQDFNDNGIFDAAFEIPVDGIPVALYDAADLTTPIAFDTTDLDGHYEFINLDPALDYVVQFGTKDEFQRSGPLTPASQGAEDTNDADFNTGFTDVIDLDPGEFDPTIDAGYTPFRGIMGAFVFLDGATQPAAQGFVAVEGPAAYEMRTNLVQDGVVPMVTPYAAQGFVATDAVTADAAMMTYTEGAMNIVDWVELEVRDAANPEEVLETKSVLVMADGHIVEANGSEFIKFSVPAGEYHLAVRHRNHLGAMTAGTITIGDYNNASTVDFRTMAATYGENAQKEIANGVFALWSGNTNGDDKVVFQGAANDGNGPFFEVLSAPGNTTSNTNYTLSGYSDNDTGLDCNVIFQGNNNDLNKTFFDILTHPTNTNGSTNHIIYQRLPEND